MPFDDMATQAVRNIRAMPKMLISPCFPTINERDYRYRYCFDDSSGSTAQTFKRMDEIMAAAGFKKASQGSDSSELDGSYRVPGTAYKVSITFSGTDIKWITYDDDLGFVAPRPGLDDGANYALLDPEEMARQMLFELVLNAGATLENGATFWQPCLGKADPPTAQQGSACSSTLFMPEKARNALVGLFFAGERDWFNPLDAQPTFEYRQEPLYADMLKEGSRTADSPPSPLLVKKEAADTYVVTDNYSWPAYEFRITLPTGRPGGLKITAIRRNAPPKP